MIYFGAQYQLMGYIHETRGPIRDPYFRLNLGYCPGCGRPRDVTSFWYTKDYTWEPSFIPECWKTKCCGEQTRLPWDPDPGILLPSL